jgi:hypothetical protein
MISAGAYQMAVADSCRLRRAMRAEPLIYQVTAMFAQPEGRNRDRSLL